jgi:hypothetical protein
MAGFGFSQEIKDERALVDEVGLEANVGLPYLIGLGVSYSLKLRNFPVYPSFALKVGTGPIVKVEGLIGLNYRKEPNLAYSINFGNSGGETFVFDTHGGQPKKFVGLVANLQRKKYIGRSKYWCFSQSVGLDFKKHVEASENPDFYLFPYIELGIILMVI